MDRPEYSDPIVIPITLTIPDPRWRPSNGRWDHGPFHPPLHTGNSPRRPEDGVAEARTFSPAIERAMAIMDRHTESGRPSDTSPITVRTRWPSVEQRAATLALYAEPTQPAGASPAVMTGLYDPNTVPGDTTGFIDEHSSANRGHRHRSLPGVQYAGGGPPEEEPTRGLGPSGQELSDVEVFRVEVYRSARARLREIDPYNPILDQTYFVGPTGFVPSQAEVDQLESALADARARGRALEGPANTFANPGNPATKPPEIFRNQPLLVGGNLRDAIEQEIKTTQFRGGKLVGGIGSPRAMANPDPILKFKGVRYQVKFADEFGAETSYSVNYDPVTGQFGVVKEASGPGLK